MRVLVGANEGINFAQEGVDDSDDIAVLSLEDLSQVASAAELSGRPMLIGVIGLLAVLSGIMLQNNVCLLYTSPSPRD